jgi:hypothetical protein
MADSEPIFTKRTLNGKLSLKKCSSELHENLTGGLVADVM